jgi:uncharacterized membrane protein
MAGKFSRSLELAKASWSVVKADKELLLLPVISVIATLLVAASFLAPVFAAGWLPIDKMADGGTREPNVAMYAWMLAFYIATYFVTIFFNTALVGAAMIRLDGGDPTLRDGLGIAWARVGRIAGYACIAGTVGLFLRVLEERVGWLGRIVVGLIGVAWTLATLLVVPVLVARDLGPIDAVKESARMLKQTWGENLVGNLGIGLVFLLAYLALLAVGSGLVYAGIALELPMLIATTFLLGVVGLLLLGTLQATLQGVYSAALYRFAAGDDIAVPSFGPDLMRLAFRPK